MITYFISSDIHGYFNEWQKSLIDKGFNYNNINHHIIICGDLFDRGQQAKECLLFINKMIKQKRAIVITGNHELLLKDFWNNKIITERHNNNGTRNTLFQLKNYREELEFYFNHLINYYELNNYIFVHGWIPCYINNDQYNSYNFIYNKNWRNAKQNEWEKAAWYNPYILWKNKIIEPNKTIVCGHINTYYARRVIDKKITSINYNIYIKPNIIGLDGATPISKQVNVIKIFQKEDN